VHVAGGVERRPEVVVRDRVAWLAADRAAQPLDRLVGLALREQAAAVVRREERVIGCEREPRAVCRRGVGEPAELLAHDAQVVVGSGVARLERDRRLELALRRAPVARLGERQRVVVPEARLRAERAHRLRERRQPLLRAPGLHQADAEEMRGDRVVGRAPEDVAIDALGRLVAPGLQVRRRLRERGLERVGRHARARRAARRSSHAAIDTLITLHATPFANAAL
jgi:hypothetical protein